MAVLLIIIIALDIIFISILISGVRLNPITIFIFFWGLSIIANILNWYGFPKVDSWGWLVITSSIFYYVFGSMTVCLSKPKNNNKYLKYFLDDFNKNNVILKVILVLCAISFIGIVSDWWVLFKRFGDIISIFINANLIYTMRVEGEGLGGIPYLGSLSLSACALAGIYFERTRRFRFLLIFPFILVILGALASMGRVTIIMAILLYLNPCIMSYGFIDRKNTTVRYRMKIFIVIAAIIILVLGSTKIRVIRGGNVEIVDRVPAFLISLGLVENPIFSSIYTAISGPIASFSSSLNHDREDLGKGLIPGMQTISPVFRLIGKMGLLPSVSYYEIAPESELPNIGTYLKDIYIDFGLLGVIMIPYFLGYFTMFLLYKWIQNGKITVCITLSFMYLFIEFSPVVNLFRLGYFLIPFTVSVLSIYFIEHKVIMHDKKSVFFD